MVIDADRERSVNRKLGVRSDKYAALRRAAVDSARLDSIRLESARGGGGASLILVSKSSSGIQGRAVCKGVGVRNRRNGERNVKASILGRAGGGQGRQRGGESLGGGSAYPGLASKRPVIEHNRPDDVFTPVVFRQLDILPD